MKIEISSHSNSLFVYGTLMAPQVVKTLLGRVPAQSPAILNNYIRHPVRNQVFPGMIPATGASTRGIWYHGLTATDLVRLDWFESVEYTRRQVQIEFNDNDPLTTTDTYIWTNPLSELNLDEEWSLDDFCRENLDRFLEQTVIPCCLRMQREGTLEN